jgi:hypothetical protein
MIEPNHPTSSRRGFPAIMGSTRTTELDGSVSSPQARPPAWWRQKETRPGLPRSGPGVVNRSAYYLGEEVSPPLERSGNMNSPDFGSDIAAFHKVPGWAGGAAQVDAATMSPSCRDRHTPDPGNTFSGRSSRRSDPCTQEGKREMFFMASRSMMFMDAGCRSGTCKTDHPGREVFTARRRHVSMVRSLSRPGFPDNTCFHQQFSRFSAGRGS